MSKGLIAAVVAAAAVFAGVWYFAGGRVADTPADREKPAAEAAEAAAAKPASADPTPVPLVPADPKGRPIPADPRLAALMVSPENALIEYVKGTDGRVIQELDNDPSSPRFRKPMREYTYAGANIAGLTTYRNVGGQLEITRVSVSYKADGSVDQYRESVAHERLDVPN